MLLNILGMWLYLNIVRLSCAIQYQWYATSYNPSIHGLHVSTSSMVIHEPWFDLVTRFLRTVTHDGDAIAREWRTLMLNKPSHAMIHRLAPLYTMNSAKPIHKQVALSKPHHIFKLMAHFIMLCVKAMCYIHDELLARRLLQLFNYHFQYFQPFKWVCSIGIRQESFDTLLDFITL